MARARYHTPSLSYYDAGKLFQRFGHRCYVFSEWPRHSSRRFPAIPAATLTLFSSLEIPSDSAFDPPSIHRAISVP